MPPRRGKLKCIFDAKAELDIVEKAAEYHGLEVEHVEFDIWRGQWYMLISSPGLPPWQIGTDPAIAVGMFTVLTVFLLPQ